MNTKTFAEQIKEKSIPVKIGIYMIPVISVNDVLDIMKEITSEVDLEFNKHLISDPKDYLGDNDFNAGLYKMTTFVLQRLTTEDAEQ